MNEVVEMNGGREATPEVIEGLLRELRQVMARGIEWIEDAAAVVAKFDEAGVPIPNEEMPLSLQRFLRRVAAKMALPGIYAKLQGTRILLSRVSSYPLEDQRIVAEDRPIAVVMYDNGRMEPDRRFRPTEIIKSSLLQKRVFGPEGLRDKQEQKVWLVEEEEREQRKKAKVEAIAPYKLNKTKGTATINAELDVKQLLRIVEDLQR